MPGRRRRALRRGGGRLRRRPHRPAGRLGRRHGARASWAVDPSPQPELVELAERDPELELVRETSLDALRHIPLPDARCIDGDHNYYTVSEELRLIAERAGGGSCRCCCSTTSAWPHARRDDYYDPELDPRGAPAADPRGRRACSRASRASAPGGLPYRWAAAREGGPRNGVLTAVEDFVAARDGPAARGRPRVLRPRRGLAQEAPWADALAERSSSPGTATRCSSGSRPTGCSTSPPRTSRWSRRRRRASAPHSRRRVLRRLLDSSAFARRRAPLAAARARRHRETADGGLQGRRPSRARTARTSAAAGGACAAR